jgi:hypothetical protein
MDVFLANPKPLVLVLDRLPTDFTDPVNHAPAPLKFTINSASPTLYSCRQQFGEAKLVPVRIADVEETLAPCGIPGRLGL